MKSRPKLETAALAAYLEGESRASERAEIDAALQECADSRRRLDHLRELRQLLSAPAPALESIDLASRVRTAARKPAGIPPQKTRRHVRVLLGALAACLACLVLFAQRPDDTSEFLARGSAVALPEGKRWAGIQIYRVAEHGRPQPLGARMAPTDGLLFSYTNLGSHPFDYLMIFAVDADDEVHWFYPAYESLAQNPLSIAIEHAKTNMPLGELIEQDFAEGRLALYALFTPRPLSVQEVEAWLKQRDLPTTEAPMVGGVLERIDTGVVK